jgi:hypothetical protein
MAASSLQAEEKAKLILQNHKEKYQTDIERLEKENNDFKVTISICLKIPFLIHMI